MPAHSPGDPHRLGYRDVDGDPHHAILVSTMDATGEWDATQRLRTWEREHLRLVGGERLLDVGCGTGDAGLALAGDLGPNGELVGVDASATMVQVARERSEWVRRYVGVPDGVRGRELGSRLCTARFSVGDAAALAGDDSSFDAVRCERTLQWLADPGGAIAGFGRMLRPGGRLALIDTDWSTLWLEVDDPQLTNAVRDGLRDERSRPSNVGRRLADLVVDCGFDVAAATTATQTWTDWNPDATPAPDGCFSMASLANDLVERGQIEATDAPRFVEAIHDAARRQRFAMSLRMYAVLAVLP